MLLIDRNDRLYRLPIAKFAQILRDPANYRLPLFAAQRTHTASAIVECVGRRAVRVVRITFDVLTFDRDGRLDTRTFNQQQFARAQVAMLPAISPPERRSNILDAALQFVEQGGRWQPSQAMARAIDDAMLGRTRCQQVR